MMPHAHWAEFVWFAFSVAGVSFAFISVRAALGDLSDLRGGYEPDLTKRLQIVAAINPTTLGITSAIVTSSKINLFGHCIILISALGALFLEPPPPIYSEIPQSALGIACWIGVSVVMSTQVFYGLTIRRKITTGYFEAQRPHNQRSTDVLANGSTNPESDSATRGFSVHE